MAVQTYTILHLRHCQFVGKISGIWICWQERNNTKPMQRLNSHVLACWKVNTSFAQNAAMYMWCSRSKGNSAGEVSLEFCIWCTRALSPLKNDTSRQNRSNHSNFTIEKGSEILVFFIILWMFSSISRKPHSCSPPFSVLHHIVIWKSKWISFFAKAKYPQFFPMPEW